MLRVMIVEDEYIAMQDIKCLINWEANGYEIIAEASNGNEAIAKYNKLQPDIIISDVKMPIMDGIEMANKLNQENNSIYFVFLTAYDDFNFARKALTIGVKSYILKHEMDSKLLIAELNKAKSFIEANKDFNYTLINGVLKRTFEEHLSNKDILKLKNKYNIPFKSNALLILIKIFNRDFFNGNNLAILIREIDETLKNDYNMQSFSIDILQTYIAIYVVPEEDSIYESNYNHMYSICKRIQKELRNRVQANTKIAFSRTLKSLGEIVNKFDDLKEEIEYSFFSTNTIIHNLGNINKQESIQSYNFSDAVEDFRNSIEINECEKSKTVLYDIFIIYISKLMDIEIYSDAISQILEIIHLKIKYSNCDELKKYSKLSKLKEESTSKINIFIVYDWLCGIIDLLYYSFDSLYSKKIKDALDFIHSNYNKNITLKEISGVMGINENYACQLFKKEIGDSFKTYLVGYRIKKAKELLKKGEYMVYEVSDMVGYSTVQYFSQIFKEKTGKTPSEYINS